MRTILHLTLLSFIVGCGGGPPPAPEERVTPPPAEATAAAVTPIGDGSSRGELPTAADGRIVGTTDREEFGGEQYGFGWWMTNDGNLVALYRFQGDEAPTFGQHGETENAPTLEVFDLRANNIQNYDELVTADPLNRMAVFRESSHLWLLKFDDTEREDLTIRFADPEGDENPCMQPRQVAFDALGDYIGWIRRSPDKVVVEEVGNRGGSEGFEVQTPRGRLWRIGVPSLTGWAVMREVPRDTNRSRSIDFPTQATSCVCLWCERFAASSGVHGWEGDAFKSFLTGPEGRFEVEGEVIPLGNTTYGDLENRRILRSDGSPFPLPSGCGAASFAHGMPVAIAECDGGASMLVAPESEGAVMLDEPVTVPTLSTPVRDDEGSHWIGVLVGSSDKRLGRLRLEDGRLEVGPAAISMAEAPHFSGWQMFQTSEGAAALHVGEGRVRALEVPGVTAVEGLYASIGRGGYVALSPETGYAFRTSLKPYLTTADGCALQPARAEGELEFGPWRVRCPQPE